MNWEQEAHSIREMARKNNEMYGDALPMIASENILSPMCQEMLVSDFHGRYAEGTPGQRYYQGCRWFDEVETKGMELARRLFDCAYADIRPTSGTVANMAVFKALAQPGDKVTVLDTASGAHISYGKWGAAGLRGLELHTYPFDQEHMVIDVDGAAKVIREVEPVLALFGQSVFLFPTPLEEVAEAAHEVGAKVVYDAAHVLGLIAGGQFQQPLKEGADVMTGSTHKTLPGPQGGMILTDTPREDAKWMKQLDWGVFPGVTSSYHLHHVAAKAIAFAEHLAFGRDYAAQIVANAQRLASELHDRGFGVLGADYGFTRSHQIVFRVGEKKGAWAAEQLEKAGIIANMNMVPEDEHPLYPSGIRLGVQELTRLGMKEPEMEEVAVFFQRVLQNQEDAAAVRRDVVAFKKNHRSIHYCFHSGGDPYRFISLIQ
ncbi:MAG: serine hydroxymethyltransferase [Candidatus Thermoplasmatota archaeon]|nr:serine hydroxymethyltransferase [Candidatus Thermoplasmatota archaeon]MDD5778321.1 serine hydroxymethyltransferase [Candidatus Thermoplasmatota archaeon]